MFDVWYIAAHHRVGGNLAMLAITGTIVESCKVTGELFILKLR